MNEFEKEVKLDFLVEATQLLNDSEQAFLALEGDKNNATLMNEIFRLAHNLKGTSRAVGFGDVAEFTHEMENLILQLKEGHLEITDVMVSLLLECNDHVSVMIKTLNMALEARFDSTDIIAKIKKGLAGELVGSTKKEEDVAVEIMTKEQEELLASYESELGSKNITETSTPAAIVEEVATPVLTIKKAEPPKRAQVATKATEDDSIRVSLTRVDLLNNAVGELVIIQTVLNQHRTEIKNPLMLKSLTHLAKLAKEIQDISMSLRMVPLKPTLQKMQRIVRDTSKTLNKKVFLELIGEDTEIDKTVLEHLSDPLVHIIRNAIDHGLETTEGRIAAGKDEEGQVSIRAYHEGNSLVIEVKDDGKGIDCNIIREKAIEKRVISPNASMTEDDIINLIFHPGFSTKSEVSEISGRGVGMDVVKNNIEKLSGEVRVSTVVGSGSTFKIVLPLTLAIIDAMVTVVGEERYIIPLSQIFESLTPTEDLVHHVNGIGECLRLRGEILPLFRIGRALGRTYKEKNINEQIAIIVNSEHHSFAVLVDDILYQQQVVIKKIGDEITNRNGFMGSSILGDGRPSFILDLYGLFQGTMKKKRTHTLDQVSA
jgi:two-component system chemotaxis sensor kinase CheA